MNSSEKGHQKILGVISRRDAENLILAWVNLPDLPEDFSDPGAYTRLLKRYPAVFGHMQGRNLHFMNLRDYRDRLRKAWDAPSRREREWHIFKLRDQFAFSQILDEEGKEHDPSRVITDPDEDRYQRLFWRVPAITPLEATMYYFQTALADYARHCQNDDCAVMPYFIAEKGWQKYCSETCAIPAQREAKRNWWNRRKNGGVSS